MSSTVMLTETVTFQMLEFRTFGGVYVKLSVCYSRPSHLIFHDIFTYFPTQLFDNTWNILTLEVKLAFFFLP